MLRPGLRCIGAAVLAIAIDAYAGAQIYEPMAASVRAGLVAAITDNPAPRHGFSDSADAVDWLTEMSRRLDRRLPDFRVRLDFLRTLHYEATRAGIDAHIPERSVLSLFLFSPLKRSPPSMKKRFFGGALLRLPVPPKALGVLEESFSFFESGLASFYSCHFI